MKTILLLGTCLLTALCALPASAAPAQHLAVFVSQATVNPVFISYPDIEGNITPLEEAATLIREMEKPDEVLVKVGQGDVILAGLLREAVETNRTTDAAGTDVIDVEGFSKTFLRMLNNKNPELTRFAAVGWNTTEKRAAAKIAGLAKNPTWEGAHDSILGILIGLLKESQTSSHYVGSANGGIWKAQAEATEAASDLTVWRDNFGRTGG